MKQLLLLAALVATPLPAAATDYGKLALDLTEAMTSEVGPRLAGTADEARARTWAVNRMRAMGFRNVSTLR